MIEFLFYFTVGFIISYTIMAYHYHKSEISNLLTTIKEDVINLHVTLSHVLDQVKK